MNSLEDRIRMLNASLARHLSTANTPLHALDPDDSTLVGGDETHSQLLDVGSPWISAFEVSKDRDQIDDGGSGALVPDRGPGVQMLEAESTNGKNAPEQHDTKSPFFGSESAISSRSSSRARASVMKQSASPEMVLPSDQSAARPRYFGPDASMSLFGETSFCATAVECVDQARCANRVLRDLAATTHDYLMDLYWNSFNTSTILVNQELFYRDKATENSQYYSGFLHLSMLAMGFRFADPSRSDIQKISLDTRSSIMEQTSRHMVEYELENPGGLPSVQALLILGDLEYGVGRTGTSWSYAGKSSENRRLSLSGTK